MIIKEVKPFGNGAQIVVPKGWIGRKIIIELKTKDIEDIQKDIINNIKDLSKVVSIVLIGSYAREEQLMESDVDIVIFCIEKLKIDLPNYHIILVNVNKLKEEIILNPALFKSILDEGVVILNSNFLNNIKINNAAIKKYKKDCYDAYLLNKEFINLDKKQNALSPSIIYSIILRLRSLFILKNKYLFKEFRSWLIKNNIQEFDKLYNIYKSVRDNKILKNIDYKLINEVEKANEFLCEQLK